MFRSASLRGSLFCLLIVVWNSAYAEDWVCEVYTVPHKSDLQGQKASYEVLDEEGGYYVAVFENGDILKAWFDTCGLGRKAHYFSREPLDAAGRRSRLGWMLGAVLPSRQSADELKSQLDKFTHPLYGELITVDSGIDSHGFEFTLSENPEFQAVLDYTWYPPEH